MYNKLQCGELADWAQCYNTKYDIYVPYDLLDCPQVLVFSWNPHSHPAPLPVKTPPLIEHCFNSLLTRLDWKLADATPCHIVLDSGFMFGLQEVLGWHVQDKDPSLHELHPSLGNLDHT